MAAEGKEMTFLEHLEELRWHLIRAFTAVVILAIVAFIFSDIVFDKIILAPKNPDFFTNKLLCLLGQRMDIPKLCINTKIFQLISIKMAGQFTMHITTSIIAGIIVGFPYIFWEFWRFMKPALHENEIKHTRGAVTVSSLLFLLGVLFGFFIIAPLSVHFLGSYSVSDQVLNQINLKSYIGTITSVTIAAGVTFELPVLIYFLSKAGLVSPEFLKKYRRHAIIVIMTLAAIITPPDIFSLILVTLPLIALYEVGIIISKKISVKEIRK
ncbi:MAG TPA: twin-arginine translocase subunit TatC [Bacteroidales bacterium]|nr:twin-arginine translocase subunit TatC [Bacteroidales bacterium]